MTTLTNIRTGHLLSTENFEVSWVYNNIMIATKPWKAPADRSTSSLTFPPSLIRSPGVTNARDCTSPTEHTQNSHWSGSLATSFKDDFMSVLVLDKTTFAVILFCKKAEKKGTEAQGKYLLCRATLHTLHWFPLLNLLRKLRRKSPYFPSPRCQFAFLPLSAGYQHWEML